MLEASRFTIEKKIKPMLEELEKEEPDWDYLREVWHAGYLCGFCKIYLIKDGLFGRCNNCPLFEKVECGQRDWFTFIYAGLATQCLTVYGDIIDVWYCYENLEEAK